MTSFSWKRKIGENISKDKSKSFETNSKDEKDNSLESGEVDWISLAPKRKFISLEDAIAKSRRLKQEGSTLAEAERFSSLERINY